MPRFANLQETYRFARRVTIAVIGGTVVLVGIVLLVLPGPAFVVIPSGLAILAVEFAWARRWLNTLRERIEAQRDKWRRNGTAVNPSSTDNDDGHDDGHGSSPP